ncbi:GNAT family N-acetyltransferase [Massilia sp. BJB1822]|uniref:GNAT family N-acetyltransferase n=1 Tax=Massilia sp. BJB1822 TaxID=2744470 RepID=UPI0015949881|nr:GNAT family protein [Massilia sp. BJB1822]NVD99219.1 GNAT family N-acetyltransferase [Massilia sp. BJB1822]
MTATPLIATLPQPTARLRLRPIRREDEAAIFALFSDPEAMRYWSCAPWTEMAQASRYVDEILAWYEGRENVQLGVEIGGVLAGTVTLRGIFGQNRRCELGYMLGRRWWGQGYMQEAITTLLEHAFTVMDLNRIEADVDPRNTASARMLGRLHFRLEGHMRERWFVNGEICDSDFYGLLRSDWQATRA